MPILENSRHEKFAQLVAGGTPPSTAYVSCDYSIRTAYAGSSRMVKNVKIAARIAELKARSEAKAGITRSEIVEILARYARNFPDDYPHDVRLKAIAQLTKMCGWDAASKLEVGADDELTELLKRLRGGG